MRLITHFPAKDSMLLSLFLLFLVSTSTTHAQKQLVLFAGPHNSASTSVENFFSKYAKPHTRNSKETFPLKRWEWPQIDHDSKAIQEYKATNPGQDFRIWKELVYNVTNKGLQNSLLQSIQDAWDTSEAGVIVGSPAFDAIPPSWEGASKGEFQYDALAAAKTIVKSLAIPPGSVTVVINYREPRVEQWISVWKHDREQTLESYEEFMCLEKNRIQRERQLDTTMDPLRMAAVYLEEGWNVRVLDMKGVEDANRDVSHVVACDVLKAKCDENGYLKNHQEDVFHMEKDNWSFDFLREAQLEDIELLFRARDCHYKYMLEEQAPRFEVLMPKRLWRTCNAIRAEMYEQLASRNKAIYLALLSQITCPESDPKPKPAVTPEDLLLGKIPTMKQLHSTSKSGGIGLEMILFLLILIAAGAYQMHTMNKKRRTKRRNSWYNGGGMIIFSEAELGISDLDAGGMQEGEFRDEPSD